MDQVPRSGASAPCYHRGRTEDARRILERCATISMKERPRRGGGYRIVSLDEDGREQPWDWATDERSLALTGQMLTTGPRLRSLLLLSASSLGENAGLIEKGLCLGGDLRRQVEGQQSVQALRDDLHLVDIERAPRFEGHDGVLLDRPD